MGVASLAQWKAAHIRTIMSLSFVIIHTSVFRSVWKHQFMVSQNASSDQSRRTQIRDSDGIRRRAVHKLSATNIRWRVHLWIFIIINSMKTFVSMVSHMVQLHSYSSQADLLGDTANGYLIYGMWVGDWNDAFHFRTSLVKARPTYILFVPWILAGCRTAEEWSLRTVCSAVIHVAAVSHWFMQIGREATVVCLKTFVLFFLVK